MSDGASVCAVETAKHSQASTHPHTATTFFISIGVSTNLHSVHEERREKTSHRFSANRFSRSQPASSRNSDKSSMPRWKPKVKTCTYRAVMYPCIFAPPNWYSTQMSQ